MTSLFRTVVPVKKSLAPITHKSTILSIGSCFAETIGTLLATHRFRCMVNPSGILFNPGSIADLLERLMRKEPFDRDDLFLHQGVWKSFSHHSHFAGSDPVQTLGSMNGSFLTSASAIDNLDFLMVTFGTAAVYFHKDLKKIVANCHRLPHDTFERRLLSIDEIVARYTGMFSSLFEKKPSLQCILTVSPVRHLRDDPHENSVGKSRLIAAVYELEQLFPRNIGYFPAYEIMMDELRDYRFYDADMAHPNDLAITYIWEQFCKARIEERSVSFIREFEPIVKSKEHRINNKNSAETIEFLKDLKVKIDALRKRFPEIDIGADDWSAIEETLFLTSIPGMRESIKLGLKTPLRKTSQAIKR